MALKYLAISRIVFVGLLCVGICVSASAQEVFKYQRPDGTWAFTDNPDEVPTSAKKMEIGDRTAAAAPRRNLRSTLRATLNPRNPVEQASLAVVTVETEIGLGSGFFITRDGYILTNHHVLELPEQARKDRDRAVQEVDEKIRRNKQQLADEQLRFDEYKRELERVKPMMFPEEYQRSTKELNRWSQSLARRRSAFNASVERFRESENKQEALSRLSRLALTVTIVLADNTRLTAERVAVNEQWDLGLLKLEGVDTPALLPVAAKSTPVGDRVYAIGNPIALHNSVAQGVLSGYEKGYVKTDAKIYPGNSGGPLIDEKGRVIGVNTFKRLTHKFEGLGFAVPVEVAFQVFKDYLPEAKGR